MSDAFTTSDGLRLVYDDEIVGEPANGPPLLCLAGLTRSALDFGYILPHLTGARVIRLDYRGRGRSAYADPETYSIPVEGRDVIELLDHLALDRVAIIGTSRGGLIAMLLAAVAKDRLAGVCLNDIGPDVADEGLEVIRNYVGLTPLETTLADLAAARARLQPGFHSVPMSRWETEAQNHYKETTTGLELRYDPRLRDAVLASMEALVPDVWPAFDAMAGLPLALIRGENSNILTAETAAKMRERQPDMIYAEVPDRGHVPFLDEPQSLEAIAKWRTLLK